MELQLNFGKGQLQDSFWEWCSKQVFFHTQNLNLRPMIKREISFSSASQSILKIRRSSLIFFFISHPIIRRSSLVWCYYICNFFNLFDKYIGSSGELLRDVHCRTHFEDDASNKIFYIHRTWTWDICISVKQFQNCIQPMVIKIRRPSLIFFF